MSSDVFHSLWVWPWPYITFYSSTKPTLITDWDVLVEITGRDHRYIRFLIGGDIVWIKRRRFKNKPQNVSNFRQLIRENKSIFDDMFCGILVSAYLEAEMDRFYDVILDLISKSFRRKVSKKNNPQSS